MISRGPETSSDPKGERKGLGACFHSCFQQNRARIQYDGRYDNKSEHDLFEDHKNHRETTTIEPLLNMYAYPNR